MYEPCGSACPPTCHDHRPELRWHCQAITCVEGCFCPEGTLLHGMSSGREHRDGVKAASLSWVSLVLSPVLCSQGEPVWSWLPVPVSGRAVSSHQGPCYKRTVETGEGETQETPVLGLNGLTCG